jgi:hypothetical protein
MNEKGISEKMPYPLTDNEEAIERVTARVLADNYQF